MKKGTLVVLMDSKKEHSYICEYEGETNDHYVVTGKDGMLNCFRKENYIMEEVKLAEK